MQPFLNNKYKVQSFGALKLLQHQEQCPLDGKVDIQAEDEVKQQFGMGQIHNPKSDGVVASQQKE